MTREYSAKTNDTPASTASGNSVANLTNALSRRTGQKKKRNSTSHVWQNFGHAEKYSKIWNRRIKCGFFFSLYTSTSVLMNHLRQHGYFAEGDTHRRLSLGGSLSATVASPTKDLQTKLEIALCD